MRRMFARAALYGAALGALGVVYSSAANAASAPSKAEIARGKYLVTLGGCSDCHTPGTFLGNPDMTRFLGGSDVGFAMPGLGVFPGRNLTPDPDTGLGKWSVADIVKAITTGARPDGRQLAPVMPYQALASLTPADARAIAVYLKSIPPVKNAVPGPFGPNDQPTTFVFDVLPASVYNSMPKPGPGPGPAK